VINIKRTYRIYREERLQVRRKRRRKLRVPRVPMLVPSAANERWSVDFVSDQLATERRLRVFNVVDDLRASACCKSSTSRSRVSVYVASSIGWRALGGCPGRSSAITLTSKAMFLWSQRVGVKLHFIQPRRATKRFSSMSIVRQTASARICIEYFI
jgi:putative transposase